MGWRFRKSINIGGFRINFSKSGIGYSFGVPGYRITKKANGGYRETYNLKGTGISHVRDFTSGNDLPKNDDLNSDDSLNNDVTNLGFLDSDVNELCTNLSNTIIFNKRINFIIIFLILLSMIGVVLTFVDLLFSIVIVIPVFVIVIIPKKRMVTLDYNFDDYRMDNYNKLLLGLKSLESNHRIWEIKSSESTTDWKNNAGATTLLQIVKLSFVSHGLKYLKTNLIIKTLNIRNIKFIFLPDSIILARDNVIKSLSYKSLKLTSEDVLYAETDEVPKDTMISHYTWRFPNKDGSPDRRYNNNYKIPNCEYSKIKIDNNKGLNINIMCSSRSKSRDFVSWLNYYIKTFD